MRANKIWRDGEGRVVLWQSPNIWLFVWALAEILAFVLGHGKFRQATRWVGSAAIIIWALLEIFRGVDYFRRGLGLIVLLLTIASIAKAIF